MRYSSLFVLFLLISTSIFSQQELWRKYNVLQNSAVEYQFEFDSLDNLYSLGDDQIRVFNKQTGILVSSFMLSADSTFTVADMEVDLVGNIYVTGFQPTTVNGTDMVVAKYNNLGVKLWHHSYNGSLNRGDEATGIDIDSYGNIYITGTANMASSPNSNSDIVSIKYNNNGVLQWTNIFNGLLNGKDVGRDIAVNNMGESFVVGSTQDYQTFDNGIYVRSTRGVMIKYDSLGNASWTKKTTKRLLGTFYDPMFPTYTFPIYYNEDVGYKVKVDGNNVYLISDLYSGYYTNQLDWSAFLVDSYYPQIRKYDFSGSLLKTINIQSSPSASRTTQTEQEKLHTIIFNGMGDFFIKRYFQRTSSGNDYTVEKFNSIGSKVYTKNYSGYFIKVGIGVNGPSFYVAYSFAVLTPMPSKFIYKLDSLGNVVWSSRAGSSSDDVNGLIVDDRGDPYLGAITGLLIKYCGSVPTVSTIMDTTICYGDSVQLNASGNGDLFYWNSSNSLSDSTQFNPWAYPNKSTRYTATAKDLNGCKSSQSVDIHVPVFSQNKVLCIGDSLIVGANIYYGAGNHIDTISTPSSCDSIVFTSISLDSVCGLPFKLRTFDVQDVSATLKWSTSPIAKSYKVVMRAKSDTTWTSVKFKRNSKGVHKANNLTPGTKYIWSVMANITGKGWTKLAVSERFTTLLNPCVNPTSMFVDKLGSDKARLNWTADTSALKYKISYRILNTTKWANKVVDGSKSVKWLNGLAASSTYEWRIKSICQFGQVAGNKWSSKMVFTTSSSPSSASLRLRANNLENSQTWYMYPNPTKGYFTIDFNSESTIKDKMIIVDLAGKVAMEAQVSKSTNKIDISKLSKGVYFVQFKGETKKLIVID